MFSNHLPSTSMGPLGYVEADGLTYRTNNAYAHDMQMLVIKASVLG